MRLTCIIILVLLFSEVRAQYFQFSQFDFTPDRVNPALISSSNDITASVIYRRQDISETMSIKSANAFISYPFLNNRNKRWSALGISFLDDRTGVTNIYKVNEVGLTYALSLPISRQDELSLGVKGIYQSRRFSLDGLYTGSQFVPDRGFLPGMDNGETLDGLRQNLYTFSIGMGWRHLDRKGVQQSYLGLSFFDFNRPEQSFYGSDDQLPTSFVLAGNFLIYQQGALSVYPEATYTASASKSVVNLGAVSKYDMGVNGSWEAEVNVITKYSSGGYAIAGLQVDKGDFKIGFSYDFSLNDKPLNNAFEVGLLLRAERSPNKKRHRSRKSKRKPKVKSKTTSAKKVKRPIKEVDKPQRNDNLIENSDTILVDTDKNEELEVAEDSIATDARVGEFQHHTLNLDETNVLFYFDFNSTEINQESKEYILELSELLKQAPYLKVKIIGHTDNKGSADYNEKLSAIRCNSVTDLLVSLGVERERIEVESKGEESPISTNDTEEGRSKNRRVEFILHY
ncbi:PorP/SprF family type IX secretion system membrane protein [Fulvivirga sediminis]|uniref:PorP/SprF family type IX secretion system membrane protein n=1 Tax=Fulvivirga sediminis TaxID=2803949 RepID=A0A937FA89_9BACT|nr:PorP/SprF family type IX secretion system membrane protein [Fulvivirga sediminis]MBL3657479.1 PorP/SprF family type IX secretion system membrane protein [Fulvivirga sediminis]